MIRMCIKSWFIDKNYRCYLGSVLHIFSENPPVKIHNNNYLKQFSWRLIAIPAKNAVPKNPKMSDVREAHNRKQLQTAGLASSLELKIKAMMMLTTNINVKDWLIKWQIGTVKYFKIKKKSEQYIWN